MSRCPDIESLQARADDPPPDLAAHLADCPACRKVVELLRARQAEDRGGAECADVEYLLAARDQLTPAQQRRLERHLAECSDCARLAGLDDTASDAASSGSGGVIEDGRLVPVDR